MLEPAETSRRPFWQKVLLTMITIGLPPAIEHGVKLLRDELKHRRDRRAPATKETTNEQK